MKQIQAAARGKSVPGLRLSTCAVAVGLALSTLAPGAQARSQPDANLGGGLRALVEFHAARAGLSPQQIKSAAARQAGQVGLAVLDAQGRVRVSVHLNGQRPMAEVVRTAERLGGQVLGRADGYRQGALSLSLPIAKARELGRSAGVRSVMLSANPVADVGLNTSQGTVTIKSDQVNAQGILGQGITIGAMSDSYDTSTSTSIHAVNDVASGDLPGAGNPNGHLTPVVVVVDGPAGATDEGRAMLQIIHDVAPAAKLCFATAYSSHIEFANNIRALADKNGACKADVIVDDIIYYDEPMFSDGLIAQAVDEVAAQGVAYFSSAGNRGSTMGYFADFSAVDNDTARAGGQTVDLSLIPVEASPGGFHNHAASPKIDVSRTLVLGASSTLVMQWNDPFDLGGVTTDYDLYVFSADGKTLVASSADNNLATDEPIEVVQVPAGTYQLVVVRADNGSGAPVAEKVRFTTFGSVTDGEYMSYTNPMTYGHNSAAGGNGVAAMPWYASYVPESFTSPGPVFMYFDKNGKRLDQPEVRKKPDFAAPDGGNTTFFGGDTTEDADTYPNFFGTSAAAPHAAAAAVLMLEAAGGPGSLTPIQIKKGLKKSAGRHDVKPNFSAAKAAAGPVTVKVSGTGDGQSRSQFDTEVFQIDFNGPEGYTLENVTIDLSAANPLRVRLGVASPGIQFDPRANSGMPVTLGSLSNISAADIGFSPLSQAAPFSKSLTVSFAAGKFTKDSLVRFGVDRDEVATGGGGNSADLLLGGTISGTVRSPSGEALPFTGSFKSVPRNGYSTLDGEGLIDALKAVNALR
jgi:hypothetical protein